MSNRAAALVKRIRERGSQPAEVQVLFLGEHAFAAVPAEYFVELGLRIKEESYPRHALVVSCANGMVGYAKDRPLHSCPPYSFASSTNFSYSPSSIW